MSNLASARIATYARYSSDLQRESSIDDQQQRCRSYVEKRGGRVDPHLTFSDAAISGASLQREGFDRLMSAIRAGKVDALVTEDVSRVSRDLADSAIVLRELDYLGVRLIGIADGIDTAAAGSKVQFVFRSLMGEMYLEQLADKTRRGQEGRARAGKCTGGLPIGYSSTPEYDSDGHQTGSAISIDPIGAAVVLRIFNMYAEGHSIAAIAKRFNSENVAPPRAKTKHRRKGWVASTVRDIIRNEAYIGLWTWRKRLWRKLPGTNIKRPKKRDPREVMHWEYPERRIINQDLWDRVAERKNAVAKKYHGKKGGSPGKRTNYPLSGLLYCGQCGAPMTIMAGSHAHYYSCSDHKKRGTCANALSIREDVIRQHMLREISANLRRPEAIDYLRKKIAEYLGESNRKLSNELNERMARLARVEERIANLIAVISGGEQSDYIMSALKDFEVQAKSEKAAIASLESMAMAPVVLPTPDELVERALDVESVIAGADPVAAREALRRLFRDGRVVMHPQERSYRAEGSYLPLAVLDARPKNERSVVVDGPHRLSVSCAGAIRRLGDAISREFSVLVR